MSGNIVLYLVGYLFVIAGVVYALHMAGLSAPWILAAGLVMAGLGLVAAIKHGKRSDVADAKADHLKT